MRNRNSAAAGSLSTRRSLAQIATIVVVFAAPAIWESVQLASLTDTDVWGHLSIGRWILENRAWPHSGVFSQAGHLSWIDFHWGYDLLSAVVYKVLGLRAVPALLMGFRVALAVTAFLLAGGWRGNVWLAASVSLATQFALSALGPSADFVSVSLLGIELFILLESRRSKNRRILFALPAMFFLWANLDIGFVLGVGVVALFVVALVIERASSSANGGRSGRETAALRLRDVALTGAACVLASLLTPYSYHSYQNFLAFHMSELNGRLPGYTAMNFHQAAHYVLLLLVMTAVLSLGRQRSRDAFLLGLLAGCMGLSFHAQRDSWLVAIAAAAVIGATNCQPAHHAETAQAPWRLRLALAATLTLVLAIGALARVPGPQALLPKIAQHFPVGACNYIRAHQLPRPLFNPYGWGGFVTWYLPEYPVAIDSRRGLYPEAEEIAYFQVMNAEIPYQNLPALKEAATVLFEKNSVMGEALTGMAGFRTAYEDDVSLVLVQEGVETAAR